MTRQPPSYRGDRCPPEIISHAVWLYHRFGLSFRDVADLLSECGVTVTYERFVSGVERSGSTTHGGCGTAGAAKATPGIWMSCS